MAWVPTEPLSLAREDLLQNAQLAGGERVGSRTQYNPFPWLDLGVDVFYTHFNTAYKGTNVTLGANNGRPSGVYTIADQNVLSVLARAQITFNP